MASLSPRPLEVGHQSRPIPAPSQQRQTGQQAAAAISSAEKARWLFTILACSLIALFIVSSSTGIAQLNLVVAKQKIDLHTLTVMNQSMQDQVAKLQSPGTILKMAQDRLHMIPVAGQSGTTTTP
ncbi:MAG: hypothetical protein JWN30_313 [Bacilli bacterium]|nr:hypothetical protein [Bacilli bacterium]